MVIAHPNTSGKILIPVGTKKMFVRCTRGSMSITVYTKDATNIHQIPAGTELQVDGFVGDNLEFVAGDAGAEFDVRSTK